MQKYKNLPKKIKCPVCSADGAHVLWNSNSRQAAQHFMLREKDIERFTKLVSHIEVLWGRDTCEVVQCDNCGFCYSHPFIAGDKLFFSLAHGECSSFPAWKWEFQVTYDVLKKVATPERTLLDIGAGDGAFVKRIAASILTKENIFCTEFSEYGKHQIEKLGFKCFQEDIRDLRSKELSIEESFDIICMFQVLQHMDRLDVLFPKLQRLMKKGGSLFIAVANERRIKFNELNGALLDMPPNTVSRWNKKCFQEIGEQNGFLIKDYERENFRFTARAKQFIHYRFLQKSQRSGSFENHVFRMKNRYVRGVCRRIGMAVNMVMAVPAFAKKGFREGISQWVHLVKVK